MGKQIAFKCDKCKKIFYKYPSQLKRLRKDGVLYCSSTCSSKFIISKEDEFSPFRYHLKNVKMHCKINKKELSITLEDLKEQWDKQGGICPYTKWKMENCISLGSIPLKSPNRASLDRIDPSKGYVKNNIQFLSL